MTVKGMKNAAGVVSVLMQRFGGKIDFDQAARLAASSERHAAIPVEDKKVLLCAAMALAVCKQHFFRTPGQVFQ